TIAISTTLMLVKRHTISEKEVTRFSLVFPEGLQRLATNVRNVLAISADGRRIVYAANRQIYVRNLGEMEAHPIPGTLRDEDLALTPFLSPDGQWIGFQSRLEGKLKKVAITGGAAVTISDELGEVSYGPVWNSDGFIYIGQSKRIVRVPGNGGKLETIVYLKEDEIAHRPQLLPGGDALLFTLSTASGGADSWDTAKIVIQSLKSGERNTLVPAGSDGRYVPTGDIIYTLGSALFALPFDLTTLGVTGVPVPIVEDVRRSGSGTGTGADAQFAISDTGVL